MKNTENLDIIIKGQEDLSSYPPHKYATAQGVPRDATLHEPPSDTRCADTRNTYLVWFGSTAQHHVLVSTNDPIWLTVNHEHYGHTCI